MGEGIKTRRGKSNSVISNVAYLYNDGDECSAKTVGSIDSGGTIEIGAEVSTYTASDVTGDTRRRELIDVIRKAAK